MKNLIIISVILLITSCAPTSYVLEPTGRLIKMDKEKICFEFKVKDSKWKKYECFDTEMFLKDGFILYLKLNE